MNQKIALVILTVIAAAQAASAATYIVAFEGTESSDTFELGDGNSLGLGAALDAVTVAGGIIRSDLTRQIGVVVASSDDPQ